MRSEQVNPIFKIKKTKGKSTLVASRCSFLIFIFFFLIVFVLPAEGANRYTSSTPGNWNNTATWSTACGGAGGSSVPGAGDNVTICGGATVNNGANRTVASLTIEGTLNHTAARTITITGNLVMNGGTIGPAGSSTATFNVAGTFTTGILTSSIGICNLNVTGATTISSIVNLTSTTGTKTFTDFILTGTLNNSVNEDITVNGNFQNDGTFTINSGRVTFGGATSNTVTGTSTTAFNTITVNKGTSVANEIDIQSLITLTAGGLRMTNGTFKLSSSSNITPFTTALANIIPLNAGFWHNGSGTVDMPINVQYSGTLRISSGTMNIGNAANERIIAVNGATQLIVEGGTLNIAGRISRGVATDYITFTMSGGTIVVPTIGSTSNTFAPIMMDQTGSTFTMTGGTIILQREGGTGAANLGFIANAGTVGISGGVIQFGDASSPAFQTISMDCIFNIANLSVNSFNVTCRLMDNLTVLQAVNITTGTLNANNLNMTVGGNWTNSSTFTPGTGTVTFNGTGTQTITKATGEIFNNVTVNKVSGTVSLANNINVNSTLTMTAGNIDCAANTLTLGVSTASTGTLTYTAGTIIGNFKRWINSTGVGILFPIGTSSYYRSALTTFTNLAGGTLTANFVSTNPGSNGLPLSESGKTIANQYTEGYWDMTAANGLSSTNYAIELTGNGFTSYAVSSSTRLLYRTLAANPWTLNGTHVAGSGNTAKRSAVSGATAQFCFGKPSCSAYAAASISGNTAPCISTATTYSVNASGAGNTYTWSIIPPAAGSVTAGQGTPTATITWAATGQNTTVQVVEANDCGDNNPSPPTLAVTLHPITTSAITGNTSVSTNEVATYSVTNTPGYTYTWSIIAGTGGTITSGQGTATATITWGTTAAVYTVRVDVTRLCGAPDFQTLSVTVRGPFYSRANTAWNTASTWSTACGGAAAATIPGANDEVIICAGNTVTMNYNLAPVLACRKLTINGTANWTQARTTPVGSGGVIITSTGNITGAVAGILTSTGGFTGTANANISSTTVTIRLQTTPQNITSDGALNILDITTTATNTGTVTVTGTLSGAGTLTQGANSTLNMNAGTFSLTTLTASASGNTVNYEANAAQTIRATTYNDLTASGTGTKTLGGATIVNRNLTISSAATVLDVSATNYALSVGGNWNNSGAFTERFGTVTFNGASTQTITATGGETFNNLNMTGAGAKYLSSTTTINFDFALSSTLNTNNNNISIRGNFDNSGTYNGGSNNVTFTNNTSILGSSTTTFNNVIISATLTGSSSNFNVTGNWTNNGTFTHNNGTVTFSGAAQTIGGTSVNTFNNLIAGGTGTKTLGAAITTNGNLTISSTLDVSATNYGVNVKGNWINNGTFTQGSGTVTFNGTTAQTIGGTTTTDFNNITQSNASSVSLAQHQNLINTLTISAGTFTVSPSYNFTLKSTSSRTARIAAIPSAGADFLGNIIMERYTGTGPTDWRFFSSAVSGVTIADWADDMFTSGFTGADCNLSNCATCGSTCNWPSIYWYDETQQGNLDDFGFMPVTDVLNPIVVGRGYWVYLGPNPVTFEVKGDINKFSQPFSVTYTPSSPPNISDDGWNLITNSYPSAIDWDDVNWTKSASLDDAVYIWNSFTGSYASYVGGFGINGGSQYIASQQAFYVKANAVAPSISKVEAVKTASVNPTYPFLKMANTPNTSRSPMAFKDFPIPLNTNNTPNSILLTVSGGGVPDDETLLRFMPGATAGFDVQYDAWKMFSDTLPTSPPNISSVIPGNQDLSINQLPPLTADVSIPIRVTVRKNGTYSIRRDSILMLPMSACIILEDLITSTMTDLRTNISYSFTMTTSTTSPRFVLHIYAPVTKQAVNVSCAGGNNAMAIATGTGTGAWTYIWKDSSGTILQTTLNSPAPDTLFNLSAGIYTVEVSSSVCGMVTDTIIINAPAPLQLIANFSNVSCNGLSDGSALVNVSGGVPSYFYLWNNGATTSAINNLPEGDYTVTVTDANGCNSVFSASVSAPVVADFGFNKDTLYISMNDTAHFNTASSGAIFYQWNFGDTSAIDTTINPIHFYTYAGTYTVTLIASDSLCVDTISYTIVVLDSLLTPINHLPAQAGQPSVQVLYENGEVFLLFDLPAKKDVSISIYNAVGEKILVQNVKQIQKSKVNLRIHDFSSGIYIAVAEMNDAVIARKIMVQGEIRK